MAAHLTVGYDGSPQAQQALFWAAEEAERRGARVRAVACYLIPVPLDPWLPPFSYDPDTVRQAVAGDLAGAIAEAERRHPSVAFERRVVPGSPRTELVAEAGGSALLVVGRSGAGQALSLLVGSVTASALRNSECPVVVVPADSAPAGQRRVVVGVDGSKASDGALDWAADDADRRDAELVVVHAWHYPYGSELSPREVHDLTRVDAALVLQDAVRRCTERCRVPVRSALVEGPAAGALLDPALAADLIVVGSRGRGGFRSLLFGSVAHAVTEHAACPVAVVRP